MERSRVSDTDATRGVLAEIKAAEDKATPGQWCYDGDPSFVVFSPGAGSTSLATATNLGDEQKAVNAAFIAASRTWLPALREAVEAVLDEHRRVECMNERCPVGVRCVVCEYDEPGCVWPCPTVAAITAALAPLLPEEPSV